MQKLAEKTKTKGGTFSWYDTTLRAQTAMDGDRGLFALLINTLRRNGFQIEQDSHVASIIRRDYKCGVRGDLHVYASHFPRGSEVEFFQEVVTENPNGGRYDFNKRKKMPYLIRMRFLWEKRCLEAALTKRGFVETTNPEPQTAMEFVMHRREEIKKFHGQHFYEKPRESYNAKDADGVMLKDGDHRYFYDYNGILCRGTVYHNLNNMWWVVVNRTSWNNIASFQLFAYDPNLHPARKVDHPERHIKAKLDKAVKEQNFERAIGLRDALARYTKEQGC